MPISIRWRLALAVGLALVAMVGVVLSGAAQVETSVRISPPNTDEFPTVSFFLTVTDGEGRHIEGIAPSDVQVVEDGSARQVGRVEAVQLGTRQLFVINTNEGLAVRDTRGRSRFSFVRDALVSWWSRPEASRFAADDLTVVTGMGPLIEHSPAAAAAAAALDGHAPRFDSSSVNYDLLLDSLTYLDDPGPREGAPSFVLFFTPLIRSDEELALTNAIARANELGAAVYPILIDNPAAVEEDAYQFLEQLAQSTGGQVVTLDPASPQLPELADRIFSQRTQYRVTYQSAVTSSGSHELQARISANGIDGASEPRTFQVAVQAPEVTFIQAPTQLTRQGDDAATPIEALPPTEQIIELLITYPDGHDRPLRRSQLLLDGQVVAERTQPPFDTLTWDLRGLRQDQSVELRAVVQDSLGLEGETLSHTVEVRVVPPPSGLAALRPALGSLLLVLAVLLLGAVAAIVLFSYSQAGAGEETDLGEGRRLSTRRLDRASLQGAGAEGAEAWLVPLETDGDEGQPVPLSGADITLGSDTSLATFPFSEPSLSGLHARLIRQAGGHYLLRDQGSVAGSWVNHDLVPPEGVQLRHGDVVHLGRLALRFQRPEPPADAEIRIEVLDKNASPSQSAEEAP